jgi:hypothetical protein
VSPFTYTDVRLSGTISDHRSRLGEDILEALECDGAWIRRVVTEQFSGGGEVLNSVLLSGTRMTTVKRVS